MQAMRQTLALSLNQPAVPKKTAGRKVRVGEHQPVPLTIGGIPGQLGLAPGILPQFGPGPATGVAVLFEKHEDVR